MVMAQGVGWAAPPVYETFDGVVLDENGGTRKLFPGQAVDLNGWSFQISRSDGTVDPSGFIVLTNQTIDTTLANENTDKAMVMLGKSDSTALVLKGRDGDAFKFNGISVEDCQAAPSRSFILKGYLDGGAVAHAEYSLDAPAYGSNWQDQVKTVSGKQWGFVDELRITYPDNSGYVSLCIDDINVSTAVPPVTVTSINLSADTGVSNTDLITNVASQTLSGTLSANLPAGEKVEVSLDNGTTWQDATATVGTTTWSLSGVTLAGSDTVRARVTDTQGVSGPDYARAYVVDTTGPTVTFGNLALSNDSGASASDFITNVAAQTITATLSASLGASETVWGSLDNGASWTDITGSVSGTSLSWAGVTLAGSNTLQLRVDDAAGNAGVVTSRAYVLDTTAPAAPSAPTLLAASDLGVSNSDGLTSLTTPTLSGTAEAGSTVTVYDGATPLGTAVATGGVWNYTTSARTHGSHTFSATATDLAGNVSAASSGLAVSIDTIAPLVSSVVSPPSGTYYGGNNLDLTVNFNDAVYVDTSEGTPRIPLTIGSATRYASYVSGSGTSALLFRYTVANGDSDADGITVGGSLSANGGSLMDAAGNAAQTTLNAVGTTTGVLVDALQPSVTNVSASTADGTYGVGNTIDITVSLSKAVVVDTTHGVPTLALNSGGSATYTGGSPSTTLSFSYTVGAGQNTADLDYASPNALALNNATVIEAAAPNRNASLDLAAPGAAGSLGANKAIIIDTTAPTTTVSTVTFSADTGASNTDLVTQTAAQNISGTLSANLAAGEQVRVSLDNGATWSTATAMTGSNTWSLAGATLAGSNTLKARVQDAVGNAGTAVTRAYVLDTTPPAVPTVVTQPTVHSTTPTLTGSATLQAGETLSVAVGGATYQVTPAGGSWSLNLASAVPASGTLALSYNTTYSVTATATDLAGNAAADVTANELVIGAAAAVPAAPSFTTVTPGDRSVTLAWSVPADNYSAITGYQVTGSPSGGCAFTTATTCTVTGLTNGTSYTFTVKASNGVGTGAASSPSAPVVPKLAEVTGSVPGMTGTAKATLSGGGSSCTLAPSSGFASLSHPAPAGKTMPYGEFAYQATGCSTSVTMTLEYPQPLPAGIQFWKYGPATAGAAASTWFQLSGVTLSPDRRSVTYTIMDNGAGDSDPAVGTIVDPIALMLGPVDPAGIPVDNPWALAALSAALAAFGLRRHRPAVRT